MCLIRNFFVMIDRDIPIDATEPLGTEKRRLLHEAQDLDRLPQIWVTQPYTIESYLPLSWDGARLFVETAAAGRTRVVGISKGELASRFQRESADWDTSFRADSDLVERISGLVAMIQDWQTPQEVIHATFLPPYLRDVDEAEESDPFQGEVPRQ
jgi:hypothetical protein